jgi:hypothetical protein
LGAQHRRVGGVHLAARDDGSYRVEHVALHIHRRRGHRRLGGDRRRGKKPALRGVRIGDADLILKGLEEGEAILDGVPERCGADLLLDVLEDLLVVRAARFTRDTQPVVVLAPCGDELLRGLGHESLHPARVTRGVISQGLEVESAFGPDHGVDVHARFLAFHNHPLKVVAHFQAFLLGRTVGVEQLHHVADGRFRDLAT